MAQHSTLTVARPYARALYADACHNNARFQDWEQALAVLAVAVGCLAEQRLLGNPNVSQETLLAVCKDALHANGKLKKDFESELIRFLELLLHEKRLTVVPEIYLIYQQLLAEHNRVVAATVVSATALTEEQKQQLIMRLEARFQSKVEADYSEAPSLIGGLIIHSNDWVFDGSIRSKLKRLAERMI